MLNPNIKPTHKPIRNYYAELKEYERLGEQNEGTVRAAFQGLLQHYCHQSNLTLLCEKTHYTPEKRRITPDGEVVDTFNLPYGYWEAKDTQDDLYTEASKKFAAGYPSKNIVIQSPTHALLYQHGQLQLDLDITEPRNLVRVLQGFFAYQEENIAAWHTAVAEFREKVPQLGEELAMLIETERQNNPHFQEAFASFHKQCQASINPNLSIAAVEEMLIQHLLTERIFRTVFDNPDFTRRNIIAREIETVIDVLTERTLNRSEFLRLLEPFYTAIEKTAATITDFSEKQGIPQHRLRAVFSGLLHQSRRHARHRLHTTADRRFHGEKRRAYPQYRVQPFALRYRCQYHRPVRRHRQLHRPHYAGARPYLTGTEIHRRPAGTPVQRGDAPTLLHRQPQH